MQTIKDANDPNAHEWKTSQNEKAQQKTCWAFLYYLAERAGFEPAVGY